MASHGPKPVPVLLSAANRFHSRAVSDDLDSILSDRELAGGIGQESLPIAVHLQIGISPNSILRATLFAAFFICRIEAVRCFESV